MANGLLMGDRSSRQESERYYLLPGMGGRAWRQKVKRMVVVGMLAGLIASLLVGGVLYLINQFTQGTV